MDYLLKWRQRWKSYVKIKNSMAVGLNVKSGERQHLHAGTHEQNVHCLLKLAIKGIQDQLPVIPSITDDVFLVLVQM